MADINRAKVVLVEKKKGKWLIKQLAKDATHFQNGAAMVRSLR